MNDLSICNDCDIASDQQDAPAIIEILREHEESFIEARQIAK
jgi:hypothetical protein